MPLLVIDQLRGNPRFIMFIAGMFSTAILIGAREYARVRYGLEVMGDASGVGVVAGTFAVTASLSSVLGGRVVDSYKPRIVLIGGLITNGLLNALLTIMIATSSLNVISLIAVTALEGICTGFLLPALLKVQASLVGKEARGSAEIINILRVGLGTLVGMLIATALGAPAIIMAVCAGLSFLGAWLAWFTTRSLAHGQLVKTNHTFRHVVEELKNNPPFRAVVFMDLVLVFLIPTQLTNIVLADLNLLSLTTIAFTAALIGVICGQLALSISGLQITVRRNLNLAYCTFVVLVVVGFVTLQNDWLVRQYFVMSVLLFIGSATSSYALGTTSALLQQLVPAEIRGTVAGYINLGRWMLIAVGAWILATIAVVHDVRWLLAFLALMLITGWLATRGFRGISLR
ncbi:MAG: MFS transporter [Candidatus Nanopelagicales bacterium]|nr:MFS transporter [Candidatus Nanopelagicales bacterium]